MDKLILPATLLGGGLVSLAVVAGHYGWMEYPVTLGSAALGVMLLYAGVVLHFVADWLTRRG
jgi:hypothetical protein